MIKNASVNVVLKSERFHKMNFFLESLSKVLKELPENPYPNFSFLTIFVYNKNKESIVGEIIGSINEKDVSKYMHITARSAMDPIFEKKQRSREIEDNLMEVYTGAVVYNNYSIAITGHDDIICEAIAIIWHAVRELILKKNQEDFWFLVKEKSLQLQNDFIDYAKKNFLSLQFYAENKWLEIITTMLIEEDQKS